MSTDRPDATESPYTVDVRHIQVEMHGLSYIRDKSSGITTTEWEFAPFNVRIGLTAKSEIGLFLSPYLQREERGGGSITRLRGAGDLTLRAKLNFWGNDSGTTALGLIADVVVPMAKKGLGAEQSEQALILPYAFELTGGWSGGMMTGGERRSLGNNRYRGVWINTVTVGHDLSENTGCFLELTSETGDGPHVATFDAGVTHRVDANTQFDAGVNLGVSRAAPDITVFVGLSRRF